jgi:hypothetical protein
MDEGDPAVAIPAEKTPQKPTLDALRGEIGKLAGEIHKKRTASNKPGDHLSDWLQAEKEIKRKYGL